MHSPVCMSLRSISISSMDSCSMLQDLAACFLLAMFVPPRCFGRILAVILPCILVSVNNRLFCSCQLLCAFEVRSLLPLTLSETFAQPICTKRCLKFLNYLNIKIAPARSFWPCGSNFSLKLQGNWRFWPHKHEKCRICLVDKFGTYRNAIRFDSPFPRSVLQGF